MGTWIKRWSHSSGRGAAIHIDFETASIDMPLICCTAKLPCVSWLVAIMACYVNLLDE